MIELAQLNIEPARGREANPSKFGSFWALLQAELSWYPGRPLLVLRIVLACTVVMFCIMVFRIPGGVAGAFYPLLVSRDNLHATRRSALWISAMCALGTVEVILGAMLFLGSPFLHLVWVCVSLFAVFFLISSLRVYEAAIALGLFVTNTITIWDMPSSADLRLHQVLFALLSIFIGCAVSVVIEHLLTKSHPPDVVIEGIGQRLDLRSQVLQEHIDGRGDRLKLAVTVRRYAMKGTGALRELVSQSGYSFETQQRLSTAVALAARLIDLAGALLETAGTVPESDRKLCVSIDQNLQIVRDNLTHGKTPEWVDMHTEDGTGTPILVEIERTVELLTEILSQPVLDSVDRHTQIDRQAEIRHVFVADAFRNRKHMRFAIRGGLSAIACYLFYMSVGWIGLSASVATCILTALPITGAARHKQLMRFAGVVLGACALGFTAQTIVLPQIDSILSYTLLFAAVTSLGAWIATSGPRIAYCGVQIVLAYEIVNLNRFSLNPSLVPARDTVLGIVLGIGAMWFIFDHLWATSSAHSLRSMLVTTMREIATLSLIPSEQSPSLTDSEIESRTSGIMGDFEKLRSLVDVSIFEGFPRPEHDEAFLLRARDYLPQLRAILLLKSGLIHHRLSSADSCGTDAAVQVLHRSSELLARNADWLEANSPIHLEPPTSVDQQIESRLRSDAQRVRSGELQCDLTELRLCTSLFHVVRNLSHSAGAQT